MQIRAIHHVTGQPHFRIAASHDQFGHVELFFPFCIATKDEYCLTLSQQEFDSLKVAMQEFEVVVQEDDNEDLYE